MHIVYNITSLTAVSDTWNHRLGWLERSGVSAGLPELSDQSWNFFYIKLIHYLAIAKNEQKIDNLKGFFLMTIYIKSFENVILLQFK